MAFEHERIISALVTLAVLMFLVSVAPGMRNWRGARRAAVAIYVVVVAGVAVWAGLWLLGVRF